MVQVRARARPPQAASAGCGLVESLRSPGRCRPWPSGWSAGWSSGMTSVGSGSLMIVMLLFLYPMIGANQLVGTDLTARPCRSLLLPLPERSSSVTSSSPSLPPSCIGSVPGRAARHASPFLACP